MDAEAVAHVNRINEAAVAEEVARKPSMRCFGAGSDDSAESSDDGSDSEDWVRSQILFHASGGECPEFQALRQHMHENDGEAAQEAEEEGLCICADNFDWRGRQASSNVESSSINDNEEKDEGSEEDDEEKKKQAPFSTVLEPTASIYSPNGFPSCALFFSDNLRQSLLGRASAGFWVATDDIIAFHMGAHSRLGVASPLRLLPAPLRQLIMHFATQGPSMPLLLTSPLFHSPTLVECGHNRSTVVDHDSFAANFYRFTGGAFRCFTISDWENIVVAGGSVLAALTPGVAEDPKAWPNSDIDLFIHGLHDSAARAKIETIFQRIVESEHVEEGTSGASSVRVLRSMHTVTFIREIHRDDAVGPAGWFINGDGSLLEDTATTRAMKVGLTAGRTRANIQRRNIQVILRLHSSPEEVISAFDVDCCAILYDGSRVIATDRAIAALVTRVNLATPSRRSKTYGEEWSLIAAVIRCRHVKAASYFARVFCP
jgi:hypothetical protein